MPAPQCSPPAGANLARSGVGARRAPREPTEPNLTGSARVSQQESHTASSRGCYGLSVADNRRSLRVVLRQGASRTSSWAELSKQSVDLVILVR